MSTETPAGGAPATTATPAAENNLLQSVSHDVQITLADQQADPNSPLYSAKTFEDLHLHESLLKGLYMMGYQKPSKIQERALPLLLSNPPRNMIGQSQSGTGKTAAFSLTMLSRVDMSIAAPQAVCVAPSRELAHQILAEVEKMGKFTGAQAFFASGGSLDGLTGGLTQQIVIGTPGTVMALLKKKLLDPAQIRLFVLDEADNMIDQSALGRDSMLIRNALQRGNKDLQLVLFSATFNDKVGKFATTFAPNANQIRLQREELSVEGIKQLFMDCDNDDVKTKLLIDIYSLLTIGQSIVFVQRRDTAKRLVQAMSAEGHKVSLLSGDLDPKDRDQTMLDFREGRSKVLIATNVIARGIDVSQVNLVVNFDVPVDARGNPDPETYLHRVGRTGRFGRKGLAINFIHDARSLQALQAIEHALACTITKVSYDDFDELEATLKKLLRD